jgi:hypothetical protein
MHRVLARGSLRATTPRMTKMAPKNAGINAVTLTRPVRK